MFKPIHGKLNYKFKYVLILKIGTLKLLHILSGLSLFFGHELILIKGHECHVYARTYDATANDRGYYFRYRKRTEINSLIPCYFLGMNLICHKKPHKFRIKCFLDYKATITILTL